MRYLLIVISLFLAVATSSCTTVYRDDHVSVGVGINVPVFPRLVLIPGYPVYYDSAINLNYFFYDGLYWVFVSDRWYASSWYNGPWGVVERHRVPLFILQVPVRYYRQPPHYFRSWRADDPPRWGDHWGRDWQRGHGDSDQWNRHAMPEPAPIPGYQREYSGERYPREDERQHSIRSEHYRYEPRESITQERFKWQGKSRDNERGRSKGRDDERGRDDGRGPDRQ